MPEAQRRSLTVAPGSSEGLFNKDILAGVVAQVQRSSLISSNLAVSRSLSRGRSRPSSSFPLLILTRLVLLVAGRTESALLPPLDPEAVSALGVVRGRLLLPNLRVSGSRSRLLP